MKKLFLYLSLIVGSVLPHFSAFAGNSAPPGSNEKQIYYWSEVGYGKVFPLGGDRYRIICRGTAGTCWGISNENGRWYIDVFDGNGGMDSWWLTIFPVSEPSETEGETRWIFDSAAEKD